LEIQEVPQTTAKGMGILWKDSFWFAGQGCYISFKKYVALSAYNDYKTIQKIHWGYCMSKAISIRIPDDLALKLSDIAKETERPRSFHVQKALESYLAEIADLQVALDRLHDTSDPVVTTDDMRKDLEL